LCMPLALAKMNDVMNLSYLVLPLPLGGASCSRSASWTRGVLERTGMPRMVEGDSLPGLSLEVVVFLRLLGLGYHERHLRIKDGEAFLYHAGEQSCQILLQEASNIAHCRERAFEVARPLMIGRTIKREQPIQSGAGALPSSLWRLCARG